MIAGAGTLPSISGGNTSERDFAEFFWLFEESEPGDLSCDAYERMLGLCGTYDKSAVLFEATERPFASYQEFLEHLDGIIAGWQE